MHERVGAERRQLYLPVRRHMARMARAAETRENGRRRREVFLRFMITPFGPALYTVQYVLYKEGLGAKLEEAFDPR